MKAHTLNPFVVATDEYLIWETLVKNDFEGFLANRWDMVADDYLREGFFGIDFGKTADTQQWGLNFPSLESYKKQWLIDAANFQQINFSVDPRLRLYELCRLEQLNIQGKTALVHKVFDGNLPVKEQEAIVMKWRSLFLMRKIAKQWKIAGFCGYIKL